MATRSSGNWLSETYQGTRRGRSTTGDMGWEMFPEKTESTHIIEDPTMLDGMWRDTLRDFTPDQDGLFESDAPRRNNQSTAALNLRENGARVPTEPWQNEDFDTQFHDHDPRGWSTEQPWQEYRRQSMAHARRADFVDDGDYSTTERGIAPWTMYQQIRTAQDWTKSRLKIFETSMENFHAGGVGTYAHMSNVFKGDTEDGTVNVDQQFGDPETPQHTTTHLSNIVHQGSAALRANTTTDHRVPVAAYGKLYSQMGLMPHESQLRSLEDDTPHARAMRDSSLRGVNKLMSSYVDDAASSTGVRRAMQDAIGDSEKFKGSREQQDANRSQMLTRDIMALFGFVEQDIKTLRQLEQQGSKIAAPALANLQRLAEVVHSMPANAKLQMRNDLLVKATGGGLAPGDLSRVRYQSAVDPKLVNFMDTAVRAAPGEGDFGANRVQAAVEEVKYKMSTTVEVTQRGVAAPGDHEANRVQGNASGKIGESKATISFANMAKSAQRQDLVNRDDTRTAFAGATLNTQNRAPMLIGATDMYKAGTANVAQDVEFMDTAGLRRSTAVPGIKSRARRHQDSDRVWDGMSDGTQSVRTASGAY